VNRVKERRQRMPRSTPVDRREAQLPSHQFDREFLGVSPDAGADDTVAAAEMTVRGNLSSNARVICQQALIARIGKFSSLAPQHS
jgi:hypothetical protein